MTIDGLIIPGTSGRIFATYYRADADSTSPSPVVLLCHGFPGNDQLQDLALFLQRNGFHVMTFHYSGSWGSDGNYSLENGLADTDTVLDYLLDQDDPSADRNRIAIVGHSLGGFFAAHTFARRKELKTAVLISPANIANMYAAVSQNTASLDEFQKEMDNFCSVLHGVDGSAFIREIGAHQDEYQFSHIAPGFGTRPTLIIRGTQDTVTPSALCADVLKKELDQIPGSRADLKSFGTEHEYLNVREELLETVNSFLEKYL